MKPEWKKVRSTLKILTGEPTKRIALERSRRRWEDNIKINLKERVVNTRNWIDSAQDRDYWSALMNVALKFRIL